MFGGIFDMDKPFWRWVGKIPDILILSLCWYVCSLPIITIIPASCALFDAVSRNLMMDEKGYLKRFFTSFVRELKQGIPLSILWGIIALIALYGNQIAVTLAASNSSMAIFLVLYQVMIILMVGYLGWLVPLQSRYNNTFIGLHINAMKFFLGRLPGTLLILFYTALVVVASIISAYTMWLIVFAPCLIAILHTFPVEKAFQIAFPQDYEDGLPVYTEQDREAIKAINKAKKEESESEY